MALLVDGGVALTGVGGVAVLGGVAMLLGGVAGCRLCTCCCSVFITCRFSCNIACCCMQR